MVNVKSEVKGDLLIITVNLKERNGVSSTGKSECVASTKGNVEIPGTGLKMGLNIYAPK